MLSTPKNSRRFSFPQLAAVRLLTLALLVSGLAACSGAEEYRGELEDCTVAAEKADAVLLVERDSAGKITGGWFAFAPTNFLIGAELEDIDSEKGELKFEAEFQNDDTIFEVEVDLEEEDDELVGEINIHIPASNSNDSCDITLEREVVR